MATLVITEVVATAYVAMGLLPEAKSTYLRDPWCVLDAVAVITSWISLTSDSGGLSAIRAVRVLRPLRTITRIRGMRVLVGSLLASLSLQPTTSYTTRRPVCML